MGGETVDGTLGRKISWTMLELDGKRRLMACYGLRNDLSFLVGQVPLGVSQRLPRADTDVWILAVGQRRQGLERKVARGHGIPLAAKEGRPVCLSSISCSASPSPSVINSHERRRLFVFSGRNPPVFEGDNTTSDPIAICPNR